MTRFRWALLSLVAALPATAIAQAGRPPERTPEQAAYEQRRAQLTREIEETQRHLTELRTQRVALQARLENAIARDLQSRTQQLLMSEEQGALRGIDSILVLAQDNLIDQRDRFRALGEAVRRRTGAVLVVLLRADSSSAQSVSGLELSINNGVVATRTYSAEANRALSLGAVDQLYRSDVLPTRHAVRVQVTVNGQPITQNVDVNAQGETVTYVQFAVRNGVLVPSTWTSRGTTPF